ncbi:MAG: UbiA prenyltransferase family protein [Saprospiraceae bacterium]|nr:UbiA prenyltransferase family protein [Saprospiraceae bacterium]
MLEILRDLRVPRILYYVALTALGICLYLQGKWQYTDGLWHIALKSHIFMIALTYAAVFAIVSNNFADLETDRISNTDRPLVRGSVDEKKYWLIGLFCQAYAILITLLTQTEMMLGVIAISAGYYVYSCEPFRLKKIPFLAKLIIGLNSFFVCLTGYVLAGGDAFSFPSVWILFILLPLSLSANFVDLKDIEGDKQTNVITLPVLWGEKKAKLFIAAMTFISYVIPGILLGIYWIYPLIFLMYLLHIHFLYAQPYREKPVFFTFLISLFGLNLILVVNEFLK